MAYVNPFSQIRNLVPERIDQGVDFSGDGPVLAIGNAVVDQSASSGVGWPGAGGWVSYRLTDGPAAGREVYVAEDFRPSVSPGQQITAGQQIGTMFSGGSAGIETGWANPGRTSTLAQVYGGYSEGDHTALGDNFDQLLVSLGVPKSPGVGSSNRGYVPSGFPTWNGNVPGSAGISPAVSPSDVASSVLDRLLSLFGVPDIKDLAERAGLILLGAGLVVAGILIATKKTGKTTETVKEKLTDGTGGSESSTSGVSSDQRPPNPGSDVGGVVAGNELGSV